MLILWDIEFCLWHYSIIKAFPVSTFYHTALFSVTISLVEHVIKLHNSLISDVLFINHNVLFDSKPNLTAHDHFFIIQSSVHHTVNHATRYTFKQTLVKHSRMLLLLLLLIRTCMSNDAQYASFIRGNTHIIYMSITFSYLVLILHDSSQCQPWLVAVVI